MRQSVPGFPPGRYSPPGALAALPLPLMFGQGCPVPLWPGADGDGVAWDEVADVCELAVPGGGAGHGQAQGQARPQRSRADRGADEWPGDPHVVLLRSGAGGQGPAQTQ